MESKTLTRSMSEYLSRTVRQAFSAENENAAYALDMEQMAEKLREANADMPPGFSLAEWLLKNRWVYKSKGELYPGNWARSTRYMQGLTFTPAGQLRLLLIFR